VKRLREAGKQTRRKKTDSDFLWERGQEGRIETGVDGKKNGWRWDWDE